MPDRKVHTIINSELCTGCGLCVKVCPLGTISIIDGKAVITGNESLSCGHCSAACPEKAIEITVIDPAVSEFKTFAAGNEWTRHGNFDTSGLIKLMKSRRSCRNFKSEPVSIDILDDLVKIGITAPSGSNAQGWTFTILSERKEVSDLTDKIFSYFKKLNRLAEKKLLRKILKFTGRSELDFYFKNYYSRFKELISRRENSGEDKLFHGAAAAIIVGYKPGAPCPIEDSMLAVQNILLGAHSMGLGSCLIGYAVSAMKKSPGIKISLGIPEEEKVYSVIALGYPDEKYSSASGRLKPEIRYYNSRI